MSTHIHMATDYYRSIKNQQPYLIERSLCSTCIYWDIVARQLRNVTPLMNTTFYLILSDYRSTFSNVFKDNHEDIL